MTVAAVPLEPPAAADEPAARARGPPARVHVTVFRANNLRAADIGLRGAKSDPYVTVWVKDRPNTEIKSKVIPKCLDPEWNFQGTLERCKFGDPLEFQVWDRDFAGSDDLLGRVALDFDAWHPDGYEGTLRLEETGKKESTIDVKLEVLPAPFDEEDKPRCFVTMHSAWGLRAADFGGKSDPYCVVRSRGKRSSFRTKVVPKTVTPEWEEEDEIPDWEVGDDIEFVVFDYDRVSDDDELGKVVLEAAQYVDGTFSGELQLKKKGTIKVTVFIYIPPPPKPIDPGAHVTPDNRKPAPFQLRCMDTGRVHRLACYTVVGRSKKCLDPRYDLALDSPGVSDISRVDHAIIKCWCGADPMSWLARVYDPRGVQAASGVGGLPGGGHGAGGTSVDNEPVTEEIGLPIEMGSVLRFGVREMWTLERAMLYQKSYAGEVACARARTNATEDPGSFRDLRVPSGACNHALQKCADWDSLVRVVLEWCGEPDEPPCVDAIEVLDEMGVRAARCEARTLEEQEAFRMGAILREVRMGCTVRLRLSSDPCLLAPILRRLGLHKKRMQDIHNSRSEDLFG